VKGAQTLEDSASAFVAAHEWRYAKTMPKWPHWYVVRERCRDDDEFLMFVRFIRQYGYDSKFQSSPRRYLDFQGYTYWTMGDIEEQTCIINREVLKTVEGREIKLNPVEFVAVKSNSGPVRKAGGVLPVREKRASIRPKGNK